MVNVKKLNTYKTISLVTLPWIRLNWSSRLSIALEMVKLFEYLALQTTIFYVNHQRTKKINGAEFFQIQAACNAKIPYLVTHPNELHPKSNLCICRPSMTTFFSGMQIFFGKFFITKKLIEFNEINATAKS